MGRTVSAGDPRDVERAAAALCAARSPVAVAGQGVLYAEATDELVALAELLDLPVMSTMLGKSAFPEGHPLSLGCGTGVMPRAVHHFVQRADVVLAAGTSLTRHVMSMSLPAGKTLIHTTNDPADVNKDYAPDVAVVGDAKLVLRALVDACAARLGPGGRAERAERGAWAERIEDPEEIAGAIDRARRLNDEGHPVLLELVTARTMAASSPGRDFLPAGGS